LLQENCLAECCCSNQAGTSLWERDDNSDRVLSESHPLYWVQVFNAETWNEFLKAGASTTGFSASRWPWVQKLNVGDYLLCYLARVSAWVGILEVVSPPYLDNTTLIWKSGVYPCRADVRLLKCLPVPEAVPIKTLADRLSIFHSPYWSIWLMASPKRWKQEDAKIVIEAIDRKCRTAI
jgi:hypothetical protein